MTLDNLCKKLHEIKEAVPVLDRKTWVDSSNRMLCTDVALSDELIRFARKLKLRKTDLETKNDDQANFLLVSKEEYLEKHPNANEEILLEYKNGLIFAPDVQQYFVEMGVKLDSKISQEQLDDAKAFSEQLMSYVDKIDIMNQQRDMETKSVDKIQWDKKIRNLNEDFVTTLLKRKVAGIRSAELVEGTCGTGCWMIRVG